VARSGTLAQGPFNGASRLAEQPASIELSTIGFAPLVNDPHRIHRCVSAGTDIAGLSSG